MTAFVKRAKLEKGNSASRSVTTVAVPISPTARIVFSISIGPWKEEAAALKAAANSDSRRAACTATAIKLATSTAAPKDHTKGKGKTVAKKRIDDDDDDYIPVGKGGKAKYTFGGMTRALADTTRIEEITKNDDGEADEKSSTSSDLQLSYLDDVPLKTRFPDLKPPGPVPTNKVLPMLSDKPLTITLPASGTHKPLKSVTDILRESKAPLREAPSARFGGGEVAYTPSAIQAEAVAFAAVLDKVNLPSQPSPPPHHLEAPLPRSLPYETI
ncbi:hypothetical protein AX14_001390 [Amanita brunnescens Koide BX004]|nr:hypothetical protein AX14_001390 [Amanita brunnescens Koide BX004]